MLLEMERVLVSWVYLHTRSLLLMGGQALLEPELIPGMALPLEAPRERYAIGHLPTTLSEALVVPACRRDEQRVTLLQPLRPAAMPRSYSLGAVKSRSSVRSIAPERGGGRCRRTAVRTAIRRFLYGHPESAPLPIWRGRPMCGRRWCWDSTCAAAQTDVGERL